MKKIKKRKKAKKKKKETYFYFILSGTKEFKSHVLDNAGIETGKQYLLAIKQESKLGFKIREEANKRALKDGKNR